MTTTTAAEKKTAAKSVDIFYLCQYPVNSMESYTIGVQKILVPKERRVIPIRHGVHKLSRADWGIIEADVVGVTMINKGCWKLVADGDILARDILDIAGLTKKIDYFDLLNRTYNPEYLTDSLDWLDRQCIEGNQSYTTWRMETEKRIKALESGDYSLPMYGADHPEYSKTTGTVDFL